MQAIRTRTYVSVQFEWQILICIGILIVRLNELWWWAQTFN